MDKPLSESKHHYYPTMSKPIAILSMSKPIAILLLLCVHWVSSQYDVIIAGGGTAGCIPAERLTRDPKTRVLLLEKGDDVSGLMSKVVGFYNSIIYGAGGNISLLATENYFLEHLYSQETQLNGRSLLYTVAHGFGSDVFNGNAWSRFSSEDLAAWNNSLWTYNTTLDAWKSLEKCQGSICNPAYHGLNGPIVSNTFTPNTIQQQFMNLMPSIFGVPFNEDSNGPTATGVSLMHRNIEVVNGEPIRQDTYSKILKPIMNRPNLHVKSGANVQKIEFGPNGKHTIVYEHRGNVYREKANKEVIISMGIINSPALLLRSGVGDCAKLTSQNIPCVIDNPHVGQNFQDSVLSSMVYTVTALPAQPAPPGAITVAYYRSPTFTGEGTDMEVAMTSISPLGNTFLFQTTQLRHNATGQLQLYNDNLYRPPLFSFNFWPTSADAAPFVDQVKKIRALVAAYMAATNQTVIELRPGFAVLPPNAPDTVIEAYLRSVVGAEGHTIGACSMNKVVDGRLRLLRGDGTVVPGIRIMDNSIVPVKGRTHGTSSGAMLIGAYGSQLLAEDLNI